MTPRQATASDSPAAPKRTRRGNQEGTSPRLRADGRYEIRIRYTDALGNSTRRSVFGQSPKACREKAADLRRQIVGGRPAKEAKESLAAYAGEWVGSTLAASQKYARSTKVQYAGFIRNHIAGSQLGAVPLSKVTAKQVEIWVVDLRNKGLKDSTVQSIYGTLRAVLDTAVRDKKIATNVAKDVTRPRIQDQDEALFLTPEQIKALLAIAYDGVAVPQRGGRPSARPKTGTMIVGRTRYAPLFELLVNTGLRRGEALGLRWSDVDFQAGTLKVRRTLSRVDGTLQIGPPKTKKSARTIDLTVGAERVLRAIRARQRQERLAAGALWQHPPALFPAARTSDYVFTTEIGTLCEPRGVYRALKNAVLLMPDQQGEGIGVHSLRHSFASTMLELGAPTKAVSEAIGHASEGFTSRIYLHVSKRTRQSAFDLVSEALG